MSISRGVLMLGLAVAGGLLDGQEAPRPFVPHTDTMPARPGWRGLTYNPEEIAIGWLDDGRTLVFAHHTEYGLGDVHSERCDESGIFVLDLTRDTIKRLYRIDVPPLRVSPTCMIPPYVSIVSPDSVLVLAYGQLTMADMSTGHLSTIGEPCGPIWGPQLSPNRRQVAFAGGCGKSCGDLVLMVVNTDGTHQRELTPDSVCGIGSSSWSPDNRHIAFVRADGPGETNPRMMVIDADGRHLRPIGQNLYSAWGQGPLWSPTGEWIAYVAFEGTPDVAWHPVQGTVSLHLIRPDGHDDHVIYSVRAGGPKASTLPVPGALLWAPDGKSIVFGSSGVLWRLRIGAKVPAQLTSVNGEHILSAHR